MGKHSTGSRKGPGKRGREDGVEGGGKTPRLVASGGDRQEEYQSETGQKRVYDGGVEKDGTNGGMDRFGSVVSGWQLMM